MGGEVGDVVQKVWEGEVRMWCRRHGRRGTPLRQASKPRHPETPANHSKNFTAKKKHEKKGSDEKKKNFLFATHGARPQPPSKAKGASPADITQSMILGQLTPSTSYQPEPRLNWQPSNRPHTHTHRLLQPRLSLLGDRYTARASCLQPLTPAPRSHQEVHQDAA
ncbi:hypothetical protein Pmani_019387 [Petrolisthes manimaculis]|uniref:Uncharacterized protein n=1 Tax=Petrolisthes manimaculis TaxID=1843537 RepID=A0AAE1U7R0_9EUCA|nr:hypothetical protein Pmani_019387 [Petrolisthes manimaculis]